MLAAFRQKARRCFDRLFWKRRKGVVLLGADADWFVCPELLPPGSCVLSGGAGKDVSFELELARQGCRVALFDPSPTGKATMGKPANRHADLRFFAKGLAASDSTVRFSPPADAAEGSFRLVVEPNDAAAVEFDCVSPRRALELADFKDCALCKLDIEGFEYEVLDALLAAGFRPAQIAVEFHHFMPGIPWQKTFKAVRQMQRAGYRIVRKRQTDYLLILKDRLS